MDSFVSFHQRLWGWSALVLKRAVLFTSWWVGLAYLGWICVATLMPILVITLVILEARAGTMNLFTILAAILPCAISLAVIRKVPPSAVWKMAKSYWQGVPFILNALTFGMVRTPKTAHRITQIAITLAFVSAWATYRWSYAIPNAAAETEFKPLKEAYLRQGDPDPEMSKWITYLPAQPYLDFVKKHPGTKFVDGAREMGAKLHQAEVAKMLNYANHERYQPQIDMIYTGTGVRRGPDPETLARLYYNGWEVGGRGAWTYEDADYYRQLIQECPLDDKTLPALRDAYRSIVRNVMQSKIAAAGLGPPVIGYQDRLIKRPGIEVETPTEFSAASANGAGRKVDIGMELFKQGEDAARQIRR